METKLMDILLAPEVIILSAAIIALLQGLGQIKVGKTKLATNRWWRTILPILPLVLGVVGAIGIGNSGENIQKLGSSIPTGLWAGFVAAHGRKIFMRLLLKRLKAEEEK